MVPKPVAGPADNEIWYTSSDGTIINFYNGFGVSIVSNEYNDGKGVITFDGPITSIIKYTFHEYYRLTSITIPNSVTSIESQAFDDYPSLTSVTIGNNITDIQSSAFDGCPLTSITFEGTIEEWNNVNKNWYSFYNVPATYVQCTDGQVAL